MGNLNSTSQMRRVILGAGLTGLELGKQLKKIGKEFIILEKEARCGGLCRTNKTQQYYWDFAVHALYSKNKGIMDYFRSLPLSYKQCDRYVKIVHRKNRNRLLLLDYPFENGIRDLPLAHKIECVLGYILSRFKPREITNLQQWIDGYCGFGIAKHFLSPYNEKIWNCALTNISSALVSAKIEPASLSEFMENVFFRRKVGREYQAKFIYPEEGIQALVDNIASEIKGNIRLNEGVTDIRRDGQQWVITTASNERIFADEIISTIPLVELLKKIHFDGLQESYPEFRWNNTFFVLIGLKEHARFRLIHDCHWAFFKDEEIFYRVTLMHNFSDNFLPSLVAEVTDKGLTLNMSEQAIADAVVDGLLSNGILEHRDDIKVVDLKRVEYTYPIPTVGLESVKKHINTICQNHNLFLIGRNGNWDYLNMDGVVLRVKEFVSKKFV